MKKNKKKDIKIMKLEYYISEDGTLKPNIQILSFFDDDLTQKEKNKLFDKIDDLTFELYNCMNIVEGRIDKNE